MANEHSQIQRTQDDLKLYLKPRIYTPIVKHKGFDPSPVAGKIPFFADGRINPDGIGTSIYNEFWLEQINRCENGYRTGGIDIPGRYYYYLNYVQLAGLMGPQYPFYVDFDLEFFRIVDAVKMFKKKGIVGLKARRKGLSEKVQGGVLGYGARFVPQYRGAITAGRERYVLGLKKKFENSENNMIDEFKLHVLINNMKTYECGFEIKNNRGQYEKGGFNGQIFIETMYDSPNKLEGEFFHDVVLEESGEYETADEVVSSIEPALEFGAELMGTFYIYGTAGNILTTSRAFKEFYDNAENLGYVKLWVPGTRLYFPFFGNDKQDKYYDPETDETFDPIPNLRHLKPYQRIGCEDTIAAEKEILRKREVYKLLNKKKKLKEHLQNYPLTEEEAFSSSGSNNFNSEKLLQTLMQIEGDSTVAKPYVLDWVKYRDGDIMKVKVPLEVKARPAKDNDPEWKLVWIHQKPRTDIVDLDVGGFDSYNQDLTETSRSLGAVVIVRRGNKVLGAREGIHNAEYPVALYYARPPRKEMCYEIGLQMAVYYNTKRNMLINAEQDFAIDYFLKNHGTQYLALRPKAFDTPNTQQVHKYGFKMTGGNKENVLGVLQTMVEDYAEYFPFVRLVRDLMAYDEVLVGEGDWDAADALALAKVRIIDMKTRPRDANDITPKDDEAEWKMDASGNMIPVKNYDAFDAEENLPEEKKDKLPPEYQQKWREM